MTDNDFKQILDGLRKGESKAFTKLGQETWSSIISVVKRSYPKNDEQAFEDAKDLMQNALIEIFKALSKPDKDFPNKDSFFAYFHQIVRRKWIDELRKRKMSFKDENIEEIVLEAPSNIELEVHHKMLIEEILPKMGEKCEKLFPAFRFDGYSYQELAQKFDLSFELVKSRLKECKKKFEELRDKLVPNRF